ncbi:pectate lyase superfamily protein-domain-containing protein [Pseudoneurospora amorphoporcata]|uniref:Pectate lyase superfamily protein-domain-containing protein n=1 Tax=Pseudoneurospora amorphoporcata TaxID=241081 RepID=A0AAN6NWK6_9PEZI|nr:pectate lyase superfamily protein-domain-containing protein [Pseudoneurospora amorphoporcata]
MAVPLESFREKPMSMMEMDDEAAIACHHSSLYTPSPGSPAMAMGAGEAPGLVLDDYDSDPHDEAEPLHPQAICDCHCDCRRTCSPSSISCRPPNHTSSHLDTKIHSHPHLARPCPAHSNHFHFLFYSIYSYFSNLVSDLASRVGHSSASSTSKYRSLSPRSSHKQQKSKRYSWFYIMMGLTSILTFFLLAIRLFAPALAAPAPRQATGGWWLSSIERQGLAPFNEDSTNYKVFRNVRDYGAKGDGSSDDTEAINKAIADGKRCAQGCSSSTTTPALVYFPPGTYVVSKPIIQLYYTQLVGDVITPPTIQAAPSFEGMAVIDADPYSDEGDNWWVNQNNFFRQIRNFVIDLTKMPVNRGAGIHWQVAQATSLQNLVFNMRKDGGAENAQQGIFMDNGSGGFMSDLTFNGGKYGAFFGNQQFTTRNLTFNDCQTAIFMNWNWAWTFQDVKINNCQVGIDMSNGGPTGQTVGSVLVVDSKFSNTPIGVKTAYDPQSPQTNGTLILDNVDMSGTAQAVYNNATGATILEGSQTVGFFAQGRAYTGKPGSAGKAVQKPDSGVKKPDVLLDSSTGKVFTRSKPQYENVPASSFLSVKSAGAKGDGKTDDSDAIQAVFDKATQDQIVYFDHGAYLVTKTIKVPKNIKITGEIWPMILAGGDKTFKDQKDPKPVFQVGQPGDTGAVEMSDLIFGTAGPQPGAIMMEWNLAGTKQGDAALWDVHTRIGGYAGTELQLEKCAKNPNATNAIPEDCFGSFMMLHVPPKGSVYLENTWYWVADHDLEPAANNQQIDVFNGRGVLIEGEGPVWGWATASEHSVLYNYQFSNASNVYLALIQTETPYFQGNPDATKPFEVNAKYDDPDFSKSCQGDTSGTCERAWGVRAVNSKDVFIYGAGLYSFFDNYGQDCLKTQSCQTNMVSLENSAVNFFGLSTKASVNMLTIDGKSMAEDKDNRNNFCATLALFRSSST